MNYKLLIFILLFVYSCAQVQKKNNVSFKEVFSKRQIDRLWVVGSNNDTAEFIDRSYKNVLSIFETHFKKQPFLLGNFPSSCDFAVFGQFTQLVGF